MLNNDYLKVAFLSIIFSLAVLVTLPKIPIVVKSQLFKIDSYIGGYELKFLGEKVTLDLRGYKGGIDVQGGKKLVLQVKKPEQTSQESQQVQKELEASTLALKNIVETRLKLAGYLDYEVGIEDLQAGKIYIAVPKFVDSTSMLDLASGSGKIDIKKLKNPDKWDITKASEIVMKPDEWVSTGIKNADIANLRISKSTSGQDQVQIVFTAEGRKKFSEFVKASLDKPFSINLNDSPSPVAIPIISQSLVDNPDSDPTITGSFPMAIIKDFLIQMSNPLPTDIASSSEKDLDPRLGSDFLGKYFLSLLAGLALVLGVFIMKFKKYGILGGGGLIVSLLVFTAFFKAFSLILTTASISAFTLMIILLTDSTYLLLAKLTSNTASGKPFDLALYQGMEVNKELVKITAVSIFILMLLLEKYSFGDTRSFISTLLLGSMIILFHYFYVLKTFLELFGDAK